GRLHAFGEEALDRPRIDEGPELLRRAGVLRVALGEVDTLDAKVAGELRPAVPRRRLDEIRHVDVADEVDQRLLDEPRHHSRIGAAAGNRRRAAGARQFLGEY